VLAFRFTPSQTLMQTLIPFDPKSFDDCQPPKSCKSRKQTTLPETAKKYLKNL